MGASAYGRHASSQAATTKQHEQLIKLDTDSCALDPLTLLRLAGQGERCVPCQSCRWLYPMLP